MGFLDVLILGITGTIFLISLVLLIYSLKSTDDVVKQRSYKRTYLPVITLCLMVFISYVMVVTIGNLLV